MSHRILNQLTKIRSPLVLRGMGLILKWRIFVDVISSDHPCKDGSVWFTTYPNLIWLKMWKKPTFSYLKSFFLWVSLLLHINKKCARNFRWESTIENKQLIKHKHCYIESLYDGLDFILILLIFRHSSLLCWILIWWIRFLNKCYKG